MLPHLLCILSAVLVQAIPAEPSPLKNEKLTIITSMQRYLTSPIGPCSFPPKDVISNYQLADFDFLEKCNVPVPDESTNHLDADVLLCMTLYDIGLQICNVDSRRTEPDNMRVINNIPNNATTFLSLLNGGPVRDTNSNLCLALESTLVEPQLQNHAWNLKEKFQKKKGSCSKICFDYDDNENKICKLILWGSRLLRQSESNHQEPMKVDMALQKSIKSKSHVESPPSTIVQLDSSRTNTGTTKNAMATNADLQKQFEISPSVPVEQVLPAQDSELPSPDTDSLDSAQVITIDEATHPRNKPSVLHKSPLDSEESAVYSPHHLPSSGKDITGTQRQDNVEKPLPQEESPASKVQSSASDSVPVPEKSSPVDVQNQDVAHETVYSKSEQSSKSAVSISKENAPRVPTSTVTASTELVGMVQESVPKPSVNDGNIPDPGTEEVINEEPPLDQGEDGDDVNFPNTDLDQPDSLKTDALGNDKNIDDEMSNGNLYVRDRFVESDDSHFFGYFLTMVVFCIAGYLLFHNKQKILALAVEGRSRRGNRRRPNTANYHKLDCNLEEAVSSPCNASVTHVIY